MIDADMADHESVPTAEQLLREELDGAYEQLRSAGEKAREQRARIDRLEADRRRLVAVLTEAVRSGLPDDIDHQARDVIGDIHG